MEIEIMIDESNDGGDVSVLTQSPSVLAMAAKFHSDALSTGSLSSIGTQTPSLICHAKAEMAEVEGGHDADNEDNMDDDS